MIMGVCGKKCDVYSRVVGYHRPTNNWNSGKKQEFRDRTTYDKSQELKDVETEVEQGKDEEEG